MIRNSPGQKWTVIAVDGTTWLPVNGVAATITAKIRKDGGTLLDTDDVNPEPVEDGQYDFDITQAESNGYKLNFYPESSTPGIKVFALPAVIYTTDEGSSTPAPSAPVSGSVPFGLDGPVVEPTEVVVGNVPLSGANADRIMIALIVGDDYLATNGRALAWTVTVPTGTTIAGSSCELRFVQASGACTPFEIIFDGVITAGDAGFAVLTFSMPNIETVTIVPGEYEFFVMWIGDAGEEITKVYNRQLVKWKLRSV